MTYCMMADVNDSKYEGVQFSNQIQNFGYLIGVDKHDLTVKFVSENILDVIDIVPNTMLNNSILNYLEVTEEIELLKEKEEGEYLRLEKEINQKHYFINLYKYLDYYYIELELEALDKKSILPYQY